MTISYSITLSSFWKKEIISNKTLETLSRCGFNNIEMIGEPSTIDFHFFDDLFKSYSFKVTGITGMWGKVSSEGWKRRLLSNDPSIRKFAENYVIKTIEMCNRFEGNTLNICLFADPFDSLDVTHTNVAEEKKINLLKKHLDILKKLTNYAKDNNVQLVLEPLNRYSTPYCCTLNDAQFVIQNCDELRLLLDTFHMNIEEDSFHNTILKSKPILEHLHFADNNRKMPGKGHIDFKEIMNVLKYISYNKVISFEPTITTEKYFDDIFSGIQYIKKLENN